MIFSELYLYVCLVFLYAFWVKFIYRKKKTVDKKHLKKLKKNLNHYHHLKNFNWPHFHEFYFGHNILILFKDKLYFKLLFTIWTHLNSILKLTSGMKKGIFTDKHTCNLGLIMKLPAVGFIQATYWVFCISFKVSFCLPYLQRTAKWMNVSKNKQIRKRVTELEN